MMNMTEHAGKRSQQRGVPPLVVDLLLRFGAREKTGQGAEICFFDRRARKQVESYAGGSWANLVSS